MIFKLNERQQQNLNELFGDPPFGQEIDVARIEFFPRQSLALAIEGRVVRYDYSDVDPEDREVREAVEHIIDMMTKKNSPEPEPDPDAELARRPRAPTARPAPRHK